jgi:hypothetical protein
VCFCAAPPPRIYTRARNVREEFRGEPAKTRQARPAAEERERERERARDSRQEGEEELVEG